MLPKLSYRVLIRDASHMRTRKVISQFMTDMSLCDMWEFEGIFMLFLHSQHLFRHRLFPNFKNYITKLLLPKNCSFYSIVDFHIDTYFKMNNTQTSPSVRWEAFKAYIQGQISSYTSFNMNQIWQQCSDKRYKAPRKGHIP